VQTLFAKSTATIIVAADRRWLRACYETEHEPFVAAAREPGRPLGYLFLDKVFQLNADLPALSDAERDRYWHWLLQTGPSDAELFRQWREHARSRLAMFKTEEEILEELERVAADPSPGADAFRQEATLRMVAPDVQRTTDHALEALAPLLEPNPRAMKRFGSRYNIERAARTLEGSVVGFELALWTIVLMRWPILAELLETQPDLADLLCSDTMDSARAPDGKSEVGQLFRNAEVRRAFGGLSNGTRLDAEALRRCLRLVPSAPRAL